MRLLPNNEMRDVAIAFITFGGLAAWLLIMAWGCTPPSHERHPIRHHDVYHDERRNDNDSIRTTCISQ